MRTRFAPLILLMWLGAPVAAEPESHRFRASATIEKRLASEDGRYAVVGQALRKQKTGSADGRYVLKATAATCNANTDSVFRDGFEAP